MYIDTSDGDMYVGRGSFVYHTEDASGTRERLSHEAYIPGGVANVQDFDDHGDYLVSWNFNSVTNHFFQWDSAPSELTTDNTWSEIWRARAEWEANQPGGLTAETRRLRDHSFWLGAFDDDTAAYNALDSVTSQTEFNAGATDYYYGHTNYTNPPEPIPADTGIQRIVTWTGGVTVRSDNFSWNHRLATVDDVAGAGELPAGGSTGQVLAKQTDSDYDTHWVNQSGGGGTNPFDLHDDVSTETTAIATNDRLLISDESVSGDPNRYVRADTLRGFVLPSTVTQAEAEAGTSTTARLWTAQRVRNAIQALGGGGGAFDLHDDVTTQLAQIADHDRLLVSDEDTAGDPNRYLTAVALRDYMLFDIHNDVTVAAPIADDDRLVFADEGGNGDPNRYITATDLRTYMQQGISGGGGETVLAEGEFTFQNTAQDVFIDGNPVRLPATGMVRIFVQMTAGNRVGSIAYAEIPIPRLAVFATGSTYGSNMWASGGMALAIGANRSIGIGRSAEAADAVLRLAFQDTSGAGPSHVRVATI